MQAVYRYRENDLEWNKHETKTECSSCEEQVAQYFMARSQGFEAGESSLNQTQPSSMEIETERGYSSKMSAVLSNIEHDMTDHKSIIFSYWVQSLNVLARILSKQSINFVRIDGLTSLKDRRNAFSQFQNDPNVTILLMTLGTGAVGLNLTKASRLHILEPQWNPSVEAQAIGRVVRLGQEKSVVITRYIVRSTVEEYIRSQQNRKIQLATLGWQSDEDEGNDAKMERLMEMKPLLYRS